MAKKRGNGEGCIRQLKDGSWEARIMIGYNEKGKPKFKTFTSKKRSVVAKNLVIILPIKNLLCQRMRLRRRLKSG